MINGFSSERHRKKEMSLLRQTDERSDGRTPRLAPGCLVAYRQITEGENMGTAHRVEEGSVVVGASRHMHSQRKGIEDCAYSENTFSVNISSHREEMKMSGNECRQPKCPTPGCNMYRSPYVARLWGICICYQAPFLNMVLVIRANK